MIPKKHIILLFIPFCLTLYGCATSGELVETKVFNGTIDEHKVVTIQGEPNSMLPEDANIRSKFGPILITEISKTKLFDEAAIQTTHPATLKIKYKFTKINEPGAMAIIGGRTSNSEVSLIVTLEETNPSQRILASLNVSGNSKLRGRSQVTTFGITLGTTSSDELTDTAIEEAAIRIAHYLSEHSRLKLKKSE